MIYRRLEYTHSSICYKCLRVTPTRDCSLFIGSSHILYLFLKRRENKQDNNLNMMKMWNKKDDKTSQKRQQINLTIITNRQKIESKCIWNIVCQKRNITKKKINMSAWIQSTWMILWRVMSLEDLSLNLSNKMKPRRKRVVNCHNLEKLLPQERMNKMVILSLSWPKKKKSILLKLSSYNLRNWGINKTRKRVQVGLKNYSSSILQ